MGDTDPTVNWQDTTDDDDDDDDEVVQETREDTTDTECELLECERQPVFKIPEQEVPQKMRKPKKERRTTDVASRRQKSRACKSVPKNYDVDFSDDAEI